MHLTALLLHPFFHAGILHGIPELLHHGRGEVGGNIVDHFPQIRRQIFIALGVHHAVEHAAAHVEQRHMLDDVSQLAGNEHVAVNDRAVDDALFQRHVHVGDGDAHHGGAQRLYAFHADASAGYADLHSLEVFKSGDRLVARTDEHAHAVPFQKQELCALDIGGGLLGEGLMQPADQRHRVHGAVAGPDQIEQLLMEGITSQPAHGEGGLADVGDAGAHGFHHFRLLADGLGKIGFNNDTAFTAFFDLVSPWFESLGPAVVNGSNGQIEGKDIFRGRHGRACRDDAESQRDQTTDHSVFHGLILYRRYTSV